MTTADALPPWDTEWAAQKAAKALRYLVRNIPECLQKISRYEAHLSREMYKALHELEALQARRNGGSAPLARIDLQAP